MDKDKANVFLDFLIERFQIERERFDRSGVYAYTQLKNKNNLFSFAKSYSIRKNLELK